MVLDGRIARLIKGTSKVGKELDSLTDMISFGVGSGIYYVLLEVKHIRVDLDG
jgi:phosphatidylserine synthase